MNTYVTYYRVSTKDQNLGIDAQKKIAESYVQGKGEIIASYEEKESGKVNNRPELIKAIQKAKTSGAVLLIAKIDRLSRNAAFILNLKESGVNFQAADLPELNTLTLGIFASFAQFERELISERTKKALGALKDKGKKLGNPENLTNNLQKAQTNRNTAVDTKLRENEAYRKAFQLIKAKRDSGCSWAEIGRSLQEGGFTTLTGKSTWTTSQIKSVYCRFTQK